MPIHTQFAVPVILARLVWLKVRLSLYYNLILVFCLVQVECIEEKQANEALKEVSVQFFTTSLTKTKVLTEQSLLSTRIN